jgi:hypothetical protein
VIDDLDPTRFLGALVFDSEGEALALKAGTKWVVDGQQRLVTLFMFLVVIASELRDAGAEQDAKDLVSAYLASQSQNERDLPRIRPTVKDFRQMNRVLKTIEGIGMKSIPGVVGGDTGNLIAQHRRIQKIVAKHLDGTEGDGRAEKLRELRSVLLEKLEFVEIILGDEHDVNEVFDRLNSTGEPLAIVDLVRNNVMRLSMSDPELSVTLYDGQWRPFEDSFPEGSIGGYFFPYALTLNPKTTKASTFHDLADHWREKTAGTEDITAKTMAVMQDLSRHIDAYLAVEIGSPSERIQAHPVLAGSLDRLHRLGTPSSIYPYILSAVEACLNGDVAEQDVAASFSVIESFLVRRAFVGLEPTGLHAVFKGLWSSLDNPVDPISVRRGIVTNTIQFPSDEDFSVAVRVGDLYHRVISVYVLMEYELDTRGPGDPLPMEVPYQKDHVLPQRPSDDAAWLREWSTQDRSKWIHTFANLVLLTGPANQLKDNLGFADAKRILGENILCNSTAKVFSGSEWTAEVVAARAERLVEWSIARWPYFGEYLT